MRSLCIVRLIALLALSSSLAVASPVPDRRTNPGTSLSDIFCTHLSTQLCSKIVEMTIGTPFGLARGLQMPSTAARFTVRYAKAERWGLPVMASTWAIPENSITKFPPVCPQAGVDPSSYSEDCLYMVVYTPPGVVPIRAEKLPVLVWIHGGSFVAGSASGPGLDGFALAKATNSIVCVIQYRLGVLGFVPPSALNGNINLGVRDVITALQFIKQFVVHFGGDVTQVTVAGQSSGGQMIRALLAAPSAAGLFKYAAIHSDPMGYGFYKPATLSTFQSYLYASNSSVLVTCKSKLDCLRTISVPKILDAQSNLTKGAPDLDPATDGGSPIRPVHDGQLLQFSLTGDSFPAGPAMKSLMVMTVKDEAAPTVGMFFSSAIPAQAVDPTIAEFYGSPRGDILVKSGDYNAGTYATQSGVDSDDAARAALTQLFTDGIWRCPSWTFSRNWSSKGGSVYTGVFQIGATYPPNQGISYCSGRVCHQDDIYPLFGTTPSPTPAQTALTREIQARYSTFMRTGVPNPAGGSYAVWTQSSSTDVAALKLGGNGTQPAEACDPAFWGKAVQYDYQVFGL